MVTTRLSKRIDHQGDEPTPAPAKPSDLARLSRGLISGHFDRRQDTPPAHRSRPASGDRQHGGRQVRFVFCRLRRRISLSHREIAEEAFGKYDHVRRTAQIFRWRATTICRLRVHWGKSHYLASQSAEFSSPPVASLGNKRTARTLSSWKFPPRLVGRRRVLIFKNQEWSREVHCRTLGAEGNHRCAATGDAGDVRVANVPT